MRISTLQIFNIANRSMSDANSSIAKTQEQISTGKRVLHPSDDPVASTKIMQLSDELASIKQYGRNIDIAQNNLTIEETVLDSVGNLTQRIRELAVRAGNTATMGVGEYKALASEVDARLLELQASLNTKNANGDYIFGGYKSTEEPFTGDGSSGFQYNGDDGQQFIKIANNTTIAASDSGKAAFVDIESDNNTISTYASAGNQSNPPVQISVGEVIDQEAFDEFYPEDIVITFNADSNISPPGKNFTATERSTGRVIASNQSFSPGAEVELVGVRVKIYGAPVSGIPAMPATQSWGADSALAFPQDFSGAGQETFNITVAGRTETFTLDANITSLADLSVVLNDAGNGNAAALNSLGLVANAGGINMPGGLNFTISGGSANIDAVTGLNTAFGTGSSDGVPAQAGDRVFIDSSNKQDVLTTLARFSAAMKNFNGTAETRAELEAVVGNTINNLDNAQTSVLDIRSKIGARSNTLESTRSIHLDTAQVTDEILSNLRDTDYAEASTRLAAQSLILEAAQASFIRVSRLTLFSQL